MNNPLDALQAAFRPAPAASAGGRLLVAGATGVLGAEVLRRLVGSTRFSHAEVLATEPMRTGLSGVSIRVVPDGPVTSWPAVMLAGGTGVVMFGPPRLYYDRERALWTPRPEDLAGLAQWFRRCGLNTLVVVLPHQQGRLPDALKRGLATLDEHAVAAAGFERVLFVRSAQKAQATTGLSWPRRLAAWMLSTLSYMVPATEQPARPTKIAQFIDAALGMLPAGTHVVPPEVLWQASQSGGRQPGSSRIHSVVQAWLNKQHSSQP
ncbi:MAG: hypothetical protein V4614_17980 [Pseudomonadota bacterium]